MLTAEKFRVFIEERKIFVFVGAGCLWFTWIGWMLAVEFGILQKEPEFMDHMAFYSAARLMREGDGEKIYDYPFLQTYQMQLIGRNEPLLSAYRNPPFYATLYFPTAKLDYATSFWIWNCISILLLIASAFWIDPFRWKSNFLWALSFYPVFATISFGQNSLLSLALFSAGYRLMQRQQPILAGVVIGFLAFKPQLLMMVGLVSLLYWRTSLKFMLGVIVTGLGLLFLCFGPLAVETNQFFTHFSEIASFDAFDYWNQHNARGFFAYLAADDRQFGKKGGLMTSIISLFICIPLLLRYRNDRAVWYSLLIFMTLWASPHAMVYEWSLLLIPAWLLWQRFPNLRSKLFIAYAMVWIASFLSSPLAKLQFQACGWAIQVATPIYLGATIAILRWIRSELLTSSDSTLHE
jgi:alpha-1,2-mannosyltransferase